MQLCPPFPALAAGSRDPGCPTHPAPALRPLAPQAHGSPNSLSNGRFPHFPSCRVSGAPQRSLRVGAGGSSTLQRKRKGYLGCGAGRGLSGGRGLLGGGAGGGFRGGKGSYFGGGEERAEARAARGDTPLSGERPAADKGRRGQVSPQPHPRQGRGGDWTTCDRRVPFPL